LILKKTIVPETPVCGNHTILRTLVLTRYQRVTDRDRRTDTPPTAKSRSSIAERDESNAIYTARLTTDH